MDVKLIQIEEDILIAGFSIDISIHKLYIIFFILAITIIYIFSNLDKLAHNVLGI